MLYIALYQTGSSYYRVTQQKSNPPKVSKQVPFEDPIEPGVTSPVLEHTEQLLLQVYKSLAFNLLKQVAFLKLILRPLRRLFPPTEG